MNNLLFSKITAGIFAVLLCIQPFSAIAGDGFPCASRMCCCRGAVTTARHKPVLPDNSAEHDCCTTSSSMPCSMNKRPVSDPHDCMVSSARGNRQEIGSLVTLVIDEASCLQAISGNGTSHPLRITTDPIPIYLQNLTLIC